MILEASLLALGATFMVALVAAAITSAAEHEPRAAALLSLLALVVPVPLVARDAGLGEIGRMGLLMTPRLGARVRIAVVTTDLPLVPSGLRRDPTTTDFCARCRKCADVCPSDAISFDAPVDIEGVRRWQIDSEACFTLWSGMGTDCARCMSACPYSHPDNWMHNLVRRGVKSSARFRRMAIWGDDVLYGRQPTPRALPEWMGRS